MPRIAGLVQHALRLIRFRWEYINGYIQCLAGKLPCRHTQKRLRNIFSFTGRPVGKTFINRRPAYCILCCNEPFLRHMLASWFSLDHKITIDIPFPSTIPGGVNMPEHLMTNWHPGGNVGIFFNIERMIDTTQGSFQVTQRGTNPVKSGHVGAAARSTKRQDNHAAQPQDAT